MRSGKVIFYGRKDRQILFLMTYSRGSDRTISSDFRARAISGSNRFMKILDGNDGCKYDRYMR